MKKAPIIPKKSRTIIRIIFLISGSGLFSETTCLLSQRYFMPIVLIIVYIFITIVSYLIVNINHISEPLLI
jgi:hypothetical protein